MSRDIEAWMEDFREAWKDKDIDRVMSLFTDGVEYFETPFLKFENREELREEWKGIRDQQDINLDFEVFSSDGDKFTVKWDLEYTQDGESFTSRGVYLIRLNSENNCYNFVQYPVADE
ncbi:YybH family protein [Candidatus Nanosalina sp. VS9-1]|uniref:YybH family protein n=1 Tax=Candidatus Nanosalina sp. VS9-1 TaxID=3388566 RepID=UPI0039E0EBC0